MIRRELRPFLKWAGGKRWLYKTGQFAMPSVRGRYIEPFLGGAAMFFHVRPATAVLSDTNSRLIELYQVIRDHLDGFVCALEAHSAEHCREYYYTVRGNEYETAIERAAQFLYLNRTCWNGLYRENLNGRFNVPIGSKHTVIFEGDTFSEWSEALQGIEIFCRDFETAIDEANSDDLVFVDPPYTVRHNFNGFIKYNQNIFAWNDQIRLRNALCRASNRGVRFVMTNADHESVRKLYEDVGQHQQLRRYTVIAGRSKYRGESTELLVIG